MDSGFNSFSGVILLKCFLIKSEPTLNSWGLTDVPILNLFLNAFLRESNVTCSCSCSFSFSSSPLLSSSLDAPLATSITA